MSEFENNNQYNTNNPESYGMSNAANDADNYASFNNNDINYNIEAGNQKREDSSLPDYSFYAEQLQNDSQTAPAGGSPYYGYNSNNSAGQNAGGLYQAGQSAGGLYQAGQNSGSSYQLQPNESGVYPAQQSTPGAYQQQMAAGYQPQTNAGAYQQQNPAGGYQQSWSSNYNPQPGGGYQQSQFNNGQYSYDNTNPYGNYYNQYNNSGNKPAKKDKKPKRFVRLMQFTAKALCFGLIAAASFIGFQRLYSVIYPEKSVERVLDVLDNNSSGYEISYTKPSSITVSDISVVSDVIEKNLPSIVSITSITRQSNWFGQSYDIPGSGSGIIVGRTEKEILVATNNHVVQGAGEITVTFVDGNEANAIIKGSDVAADLAVVALDIADIPKETLDKITVAKLGNSDEVKVGELAIAIGNALGYGQSVTVGYISAKDREVEVSDGYLQTKKMILLQTDAAINPGNSGGALLNSKGEVIGINSVKYAKEEVEGMGFAIPISTAIPIINELMSREILSEHEQGFLGISGTDVTEDVSEAYNMPVGVYVYETVEGGPAQKAGLQQGDIIIKVDEIKITSISQLREYVNSRRVGTNVKLTYMRYENGQYKENMVTVTLGKNPNLTE